MRPDAVAASMLCAPPLAGASASAPCLAAPTTSLSVLRGDAASGGVLAALPSERLDMELSDAGRSIPRAEASAPPLATRGGGAGSPPGGRGDAPFAKCAAASGVLAAAAARPEVLGGVWLWPLPRASEHVVARDALPRSAHVHAACSGRGGRPKSSTFARIEDVQQTVGFSYPFAHAASAHSVHHARSHA